MKKILIFLLLSSSFFTYLSSEERDPCSNKYEIAFKIMMHRQSGTTLPEMMSIFPGIKTQSKNLGINSIVTDFYKELILIAYSKPVMLLENSKITAANNFANNVVLTCYKTH